MATTSPATAAFPQGTLVPAAAAALVIGLGAGGLFWLAKGPGAPAPAPVAVVSPGPDAGAAPLPEPDGGSAPLPPDGGVLAALPEPSATAPDAGRPPPRLPALKTATVSIRGPLESSLVHAAGRAVGKPLSQVVARTLRWWLRVPRDLARGDRLQVVYEPRAGQEPVVHALRYVSARAGRTLEAFRFQAFGDPFARLYEPDGRELEPHLVDGPLDQWEQITSVLNDGRRHKGLDFKVPVGTPVKAPFDGVLTRRTWGFRTNGNSLALQETGGQRRTALFLHLSKLPRSAVPGLAVKKGEVLAASGNSGRSFAPHLHYQLQQGSRVLDPLKSHGTVRAALPQAERPAFEEAVSRLRAVLPAAPPAG